MPAPVASGWSIAGWAFHPLESAAFARRTPIEDIQPRFFCSKQQSLGQSPSGRAELRFAIARRLGLRPLLGERVEFIWNDEPH
ncbi:hypothetical protein EWH10_21295 [Sphingobium fuliginis]|nr:hypothetical protein EWH10_21295 [Sphingobium fuliginis]